MDHLQTVPRLDDEAATAADLELLQDFVNTNNIEAGHDAGATPAQLRDWLVERNLLDPGASAEPDAHARAIAVREGIRELGRRNNDEPFDARAVDAMNRAAAAVPVTLALTPAAWQVVPAADGIDGFLGRLLGIVARSMADGSWSRIKACRNCVWLFHDQSRNRSGTWCTMAVCGSRMKARAYRARRRASAGREAAG